VDKYWASVVGTVLPLLGDPDDVEDAAQEAFIRAYRCLDDLKDPDKFPAWLHTIARNAARKMLRQRRLEQQRLPDYELSSHVSDSDLGLPLGYRELKLLVNSLAPPDRAVVTLFYLAGIELNRIAKQLNIPVGTAKSRLHRSRKLMRERIRDMAPKSHERTDPLNKPPRDVIGGMRGLINWQVVPADEELSSWRPPAWSDQKALKKIWRMEGNAIVGTSGKPSEEPPSLIAGEPTWADYELSFLMTPISGGNAQVGFRMSADERSYYLFDFLLGWQAVGIYRVIDGWLTKLSVVNHALHRGQEYEVQVAVRGASLTSYVDGKLVNQLTDETFRMGTFGLLVWQSSTAYRDVRYRLLH
jgi:RNA polymerase sigma-70 factor (ECF subfamily)